jgi:hypothetical protein
MCRVSLSLNTRIERKKKMKHDDDDVGNMRRLLKGIITIYMCLIYL